MRFNQTSADITVSVLSLSRFCPDFPENRVRCLSAVRILGPISFCPDIIFIDACSQGPVVLVGLVPSLFYCSSEFWLKILATGPVVLVVEFLCILFIE